MKVIFDAGQTVPIKAWIDGVPVEDKALRQLKNLASMPFIFKHVAAMPDVHWGQGATIGSVYATEEAIIPAAVGVDIGCGMMAWKTSLTLDQVGDARAIRSAIEKVVPVGRTGHGGKSDRGSWGRLPQQVSVRWMNELQKDYEAMVAAHPDIGRSNSLIHLGTLGTGNHFIEICRDQQNGMWILLHSGSRGVGNKIGTYFIQRARAEMEKHRTSLPDADLAYLSTGTQLFEDYIFALNWAQRFALVNREIMALNIFEVLADFFPDAVITDKISCHHNYMAWEKHFGRNVMVTRKGAVRAQQGDKGIIPGSMGARSYIVCGLGNAESFCSCSHGAGRAMSRTEAKRKFTLADHATATAGVECRKDAGVIDETPGAYKPIDAVMAAQTDLVRTENILQQILCVKG